MEGLGWRDDKVRDVDEGNEPSQRSGWVEVNWTGYSSSSYIKV